MIEQLVVEMQRCHYAWPTPDPKQFQICLWSMWIQCCCQLQQQGGAGISQKQLDALCPRAYRRSKRHNYIHSTRLFVDLTRTLHVLVFKY